MADFFPGVDIEMDCCQFKEDRVGSLDMGAFEVEHDVGVPVLLRHVELS